MYSHSVFQYLVLFFMSDHCQYHCQCISWCFSWHSRLLILCWLCHHMSIGMCRVVFFFAMINKDEPVIYSFVFWTQSPPQRLIFRYSCSLIKICPSYAYSCFFFFCYFTRPCSFGRGNKQLSSTGTDHYMHVHNNKLITWELWSMNFNICFFIFLFFFLERTPQVLSVILLWYCSGPPTECFVFHARAIEAYLLCPKVGNWHNLTSAFIFFLYVMNSHSHDIGFLFSLNCGICSK